MTLAGSKANNPDRLGSPLRGLNPYLFSAGRLLADDPDVGVEEASTGVYAWQSHQLCGDGQTRRA